MITHPSTASRRRGWAALLAALGLLVVSACGTTGAEPDAGPSTSADGCITDFEAGTDYYPDKLTLDHAENFTLEYHDHYQVLTVKQPTAGGEPESYVLVKCGAEAPELTGDLEGAVAVETPVDSVFSASTTHLPSIEALGLLDSLTGVAAKATISSEAALERVADESVVEFAAAGEADTEAIVAAQPDVLVTGGFEDPNYANVREAGVPVLADAEFLEADPLGRAEWIKYFAALTGTEAKANEVFDEVVANYQETAAIAAAAEETEVMLGDAFQGQWSVPGGDSFAARVVADAQGTYAWAEDTSTGSIPSDLETVFDKSGKAEIWLTTSNWTSRDQALAEEARLAEFASFESGTVWAPSKQVNEAGGNNYYELGVLRPDLILADQVAILHPDLAPDHEFTFYNELQ